MYIQLLCAILLFTKGHFLAASRAAFVASVAIGALSAPAFAQTASVGATVYYKNRMTGPSGGNAHESCFDKPGDGHGGQPGGSIDATVSYGGASGSTYDGTLIVASSTDGKGGTGGSGEHCGYAGGGGGTGGSVTLKTSSLSGTYKFNYTGIYVLSQRGQWQRGGR